MATKTFRVPAISCMHCVQRIAKALSAVSGVQKVQADVVTKQVVVVYEGEEAVERARQVLTEIGYPPEG